jgi:hypothetical protein
MLILIAAYSRQVEGVWRSLRNAYCTSLCPVSFLLYGDPHLVPSSKTVHVCVNADLGIDGSQSAQELGLVPQILHAGNHILVMLVLRAFCTLCGGQGQLSVG